MRTDALFYRLFQEVVLGHFPNLRWKELAKMLDIKDYRESRAYQEAKEEGLEQGEVATREEIAQRLLQREFAVKEVVSLTGLPVKQVEKLRKKLAK